MKTKEEVKSNRLKALEKKFAIIEKSKNYLEQELFKIRDIEKKLREKIRKEKKAISLLNMAKKLRVKK
ncbi:unnamed protein product [marine sediment metagenome]|uniref:Uncharacterized protein n=1 Tax=marine sediment metagenome TaxID=412755 RepID=X1UHC7_9ZZZZ